MPYSTPNLYYKCDTSIAGNASFESYGLVELNGISVNGIVYDAIPAIDMTDQTAVNNFLVNSNIAHILYTYDNTTGNYLFQVTEAIQEPTNFGGVQVFNFINITINADTTPIGQQIQFATPSNCHWLPPVTSDGVPIPVFGCTDNQAINYNSEATYDDGTCEYIPTGTADILRCCLGRKQYNLAQEWAKNLPSKDCCGSKKVVYLQYGVDMVLAYIPVGTIIKDAIVPQPEILATAEEIFDFINTGVFISSLTLSINGVTLASITDTYYPTVPQLVIDLFTAFQSSGTAYSVAKSSITLDYTAPVGSGVSGDNFPVATAGSQTYYQTDQIIPTADQDVMFGCFDPVRGEVCFAVFTGSKLITMVNGVINFVVDIVENGTEAIYNPVTDRKYITLASIGELAIVDNTNTLITPNLISDGTGCSFGLYNPINQLMWIANTLGTDQSAGMTGSVSLFDSAELRILDIAMPADTYPICVAYQPISGDVYVVGDGDYISTAQPNTIQRIDGGGYTITSSSIFTEVAHPKYCAIVDNAGTYELWIVGDAGVVGIYDAITLNFIQSVVFTGTPDLRCIKNIGSDGYVWVSGDTGYGVIRATDKVIIRDFIALGCDLNGMVEDTASGKVYMAAPVWDLSQPDAILEIEQIVSDISREDDFTGGQSEITGSADAIVIREIDNCGVTDAQNEAKITRLLEDCKECCPPTPYIRPSSTTTPVVPVDPCDISKVDTGIIHCSSTTIVNVIADGNMSYLTYYYSYQYSIDGGATWVNFGGNDSIQVISDLPNFGVDFYLFRITIRCTAESTQSRLVEINQDAYLPFYNFLTAIVNGVPRPILRSIDGVNFFASTDTIEIIQPNINFSTAVTGPVNWSDSDHLFSPGELLAGTYEATFTDISGGINNGCSGGNGKEFVVAVMDAPTITGDSAKCFAAAAVVLDAGAGYDVYTWYLDDVATGDTTQTISASVGGTYTVTVEMFAFPGDVITSAPFVFTVYPALPTLNIVSVTGCVTTLSPQHWQMVTGNFFTVTVTPGFLFYDFGDGAGLQTSNQYAYNGAVSNNIVAYGLYGCPSNEIPFVVTVLDGDIAYEIDLLVPAPSLSVRVRITDTRVDVATLSILMDSDPPSSSTVFNNQINFIYTPPGGIALIGGLNISNQTDPVTGCAMALFISYP